MSKINKRKIIKMIAQISELKTGKYQGKKSTKLKADYSKSLLKLLNPQSCCPRKNERRSK